MTKKGRWKVALVMGATSGIGLTTIKRFVQEGAFVFVTGRRQAQLDKEVNDAGNSLGIRVDSARVDQLDRLFGEIKAEKVVKRTSP